MKKLWCVCVALALAAGMAGADPVLRSSGVLNADDPTLEDGRPVDWYRQSLTAGTRYIMWVRADELDAALVVRFPDGATLSNDDFSGSTPAVVYSAVRFETVEIGVTNSTSDQEGPYTLIVQSLPAARSAQSGQRTTRTLGADSSVDVGDGERWFVDSVLLTGARGERMTIRLESQDFDTFLRMQSRDGLAEENDDVLDGTNSELSLVFTQRTQVEVLIRSIAADEQGEYTLQVEQEGIASTLDVGRTIEGTLEKGSVPYLMDGKRGQAFYVRVDSNAFDPLVEVVDRLGRRSLNDDWGDSNNARLLYVFPEDGTVIVSVQRSDDSSAGAYALTASAASFRAADYARAGRQIAEEASVKGYLDTTALTREGKYAHRYTFTAQAYEVIKATLASDDFDAYLTLVGPDDFGAENDDDEDYDSRLEVACPVAGEYALFATTSGDWTTGVYELSFGRLGVVEPAMDTAASLETSDERDISGRYFDAYTVEVAEGATLTVDLLSDEFDAFLFVWDPYGDEIQQDDDGGGDSDARVTVSGATGGTWTIYATSNDHGETGQYTVRVLTY